MRGSSLVADVGGTNARFALCEDGEPVESFITRSCDAHAGFADALESALRELEAAPGRAAIAAAGPVRNGTVELTNRNWRVDPAELRERFGLSLIRLVNDFAAIARALPALGADDLEPLGCEARPVEGPKAVLGPGTGLGVAALVPGTQGWSVVAGEGGHATLAPADRFELRLLEQLWRTQRHVSREDLLCGPGLMRLHRAVAAAMRADPVADVPQQLAAAALAAEDGVAARTLRLFSRMLGSYAGDLALIYGATGGVYVAGGVPLRLGRLFDAAGFRERFEAKGPYRDYLSAIPTWLIVHPCPALTGLSLMLREDMA